MSEATDLHSSLTAPPLIRSRMCRNQGFGRALLQALEDLCRALGVPCMLLCSTDDQVTRDTWAHLGFSFTSPQQLAALGVGEGDLLHMDNTVQMHKQVAGTAGRPVCGLMWPSLQSVLEYVDTRQDWGNAARSGAGPASCCRAVLHMDNTMHKHKQVADAGRRGVSAEPTGRHTGMLAACCDLW